MLSQIRTWQVLASQMAVAVVVTVLFALVVHFPNLACRPDPPPSALFLVLFCATPLLVMLLAAAGARSPRAKSWLVLSFAILAWCATWYGLLFVWLNTFGS